MAFHSTCRNPAYRPDIDGLRAVAVLAVVFYHAGIPGFSGGFVGVDIFFVISGFLITGIVWSEIDDKEFSLQRFYIRRIKRIFPALFAVLIVTSIAAFALLIPRDLEEFGQSVNAATLFSSNFHYLKSAGYFDGPAVEKPLLHTWSLSVEEQFYAAWPLILILLSRTLPSRRVLHVIIGLCIISLIFTEARLIAEFPKELVLFPLVQNVGAAYWSGPGRYCGLLAARTTCNRTGSGGTGRNRLGGYLLRFSIPFPGLTALLPCAAAALIIASGSTGNPVSRVLSIAPIRRIGLISYSLYLIHWPLFSFAHLYFNEELSLAIRFIIVALSFLLAYLSWRFIETPFRAASVPRFAVFGAAAAAMVSLCLAGFSFSESGGFPQRVDDKVLRVEEAGWDLAKYCRAVSIPGLSGVAACELGAEKRGSYDFIVWGTRMRATSLRRSTSSQRNGSCLACFSGMEDVTPSSRTRTLQETAVSITRR